ncbi:unnamed protein product [Rodentolepis nana]|uniref:histone acetyltransferase n=1 Tax=Rodentolepis nana TaxID=102285 RepID=A0A0R3TP69_RODNA|nr:unnamed protein product [Rodentolepis nana]
MVERVTEARNGSVMLEADAEHQLKHLRPQVLKHHMSSPDAEVKRMRLASQEQFHLPIQHAANCRQHVGSCSRPGCEHARRVLAHAGTCQLRENCPTPGCLIAKDCLRMMCIHCRVVHSSDPINLTLHFDSDSSFVIRLIPKPCQNLELSQVTTAKAFESKRFYSLKVCNLHDYYTELESVLFHNSRTPSDYYDSLGVIDKVLQRRASVSNNDPSRCPWKKWTRAELLNSFLGLLEYLFYDERASWFRFPVDIIALNIPDYPDIVKNPMDLSTIRHKLECMEYKDPWEVVEDFNLIFNNAKLYNSKASIVHSCAVKICELFNNSIDHVMQEMGFCCGQKYFFYTSMNCSSRGCTINFNDVYYYYKNEKTEFECVHCSSCHGKMKAEFRLTDTISNESLKLKKSDFKKYTNTDIDDERFIQCQRCGRRFHQICALHLDEIWTDGYFCPGCLQRLGISRQINPFTAKNLPTNKLSNFLERKVNDFLTSEGASECPVIIRVASSSYSFVKILPHFKDYLRINGRAADDCMHCIKGIFAFQKIHGKEVCLFGFFVQEHGIESLEQNRGAVYLAYVDSVQYFQPRRYRTSTYHIILSSYLEYVKERGFLKAYLFACPPVNNSNYLFNKRPVHQLIPSQRRLQQWYVLMLLKAKQERIIEDFTDFQSAFKGGKFRYLHEIPYFDGDYWPGVLENILEKSMGTNNKGIDNKEAFDKAIQEGISKSLDCLDKGYFVITLKSQPNFTPHMETNFITSKVMSNWDSFLAFTTQNSLEFSTLRRAKFSTMRITYELHMERPWSHEHCNICLAVVECIKTCTVCKFFNLCRDCYSRVNHPHAMIQTMTGLKSPSCSNSVKENTAIQELASGSDADITKDAGSCNDERERDRPHSSRALL